jgi:geranylgeranylglycerol-phosphate geranylgeranyltransferase
MAGNVLNDIFDVRADAANRRKDRPLARRRVNVPVATACLVVGAAGGLMAAAAARPTLLPIGAALLVVMVAYSPLLKPLPLVGNLAVAAIAGLPPMYGALAVDHSTAGLVPWSLGAMLHLVREIVKDVEDTEGDRIARRRTLPVTLGPRVAGAVAGVAAVVFVPLSLVLPARAGYSGVYFVVALPAQMAVVVAASRLLLGEITWVSSLLKAAMVIGIAALVVGRLV